MKTTKELLAELRNTDACKATETAAIVDLLEHHIGILETYLTGARRHASRQELKIKKIAAIIEK